MKIAFVNNSKGYNRDFIIIQGVHCDCKRSIVTVRRFPFGSNYCTTSKTSKE